MERLQYGIGGVRCPEDNQTHHVVSRTRASLRRWFEPALLVLTLGALVFGAGGWALGAPTAADIAWGGGTVIAIVPAEAPSAVHCTRAVGRHGSSP